MALQRIAVIVLAVSAFACEDATGNATSSSDAHSSGAELEPVLGTPASECVMVITPEEPLGAAGGGESCGPVCEEDAGETDAGATDAWGGDALNNDAGDANGDALDDDGDDGDDADVVNLDVVDDESPDTGVSDAGTSDTSLADGGLADSGTSDVSPPDVLWDSGVDTGGSVTVVSDAGAADVPDAGAADVTDAAASDVYDSSGAPYDGAADAYDSSGAPYDGAPSPDSLLNDAVSADAQSTSDGGGQPTTDAVAPLPFSSPRPADKPAMCEGKPVAPYVQVGRDAPFEVVKYNLPDVDGHKLLVAICSMDLPSPFPASANAVTLARRYKSITVHRWASIGVNCKKSTEKETVWDVYDVILAGPPEDRHHVTEFLFNEVLKISLKGSVHIPELRPKERERMAQYFDRAHDSLLSTLRLKALDKYHPIMFEHEMNHVQINRDYLEARERIVNDPRYPATITTPVGTPAEVVREMVLKAVKKDVVERLKRVLAEMRACNDAYHDIVKEPISYQATLRRCVCGPSVTKHTGNAREYVETACMDLASSAGPQPRKMRYKCKYSD